MHRVLITGGTGFVGSHTIEAYLSSGWNVRAMVRDPERLSWLRELRTEIIVGKLSDTESLLRAASGCDVVVHCAGLTKALRERDFMEVNSVAVGRFASACQEVGVQRFVLCSSLAAAGPSGKQSAKSEGDACNPISAYGKSKLEGERRIADVCKSMEWVILRPPAVMGPRDLQFVPLFRAVKRLGLYPEWGTGTQRYSLIYVRDLARGLLLAGESAFGVNQTYFVAMSDAFTWKSVSQRLGAILHRSIRVLRVPVPAIRIVAPILELCGRLAGKPAMLSREKLREILADGWVCNSSKIQQQIGFSCQYDLDAILTETVADYEQRGWI